MESGETWCWKDPRNSILVQFWMRLFPGTKVVVCLRNPLEVAMSLSARVDQRIGFQEALELLLEYSEILQEILSPRCLVTHFESYFYAPDDELARLYDFAGLRPVTRTLQNAKRHIVEDFCRIRIPDGALRDAEYLPDRLLD